MNRWKLIVVGCCRAPVFWAAALLAGFGIWLYGYEAGHVATSQAPAADTADRPAQGGPANGESAPDGVADDVADDDAAAAPRRWIREADVLVRRGDELILETGLPAKFLDRVSLHPEDIRQALEDADRRLREDAIPEKEEQ